MSHTRDIYLGLKALLIASGVTDAIVYGDLPTTPDRAVAITAYGALDEPKVALSKIRVQVMCRGLPSNNIDADDLADAIFDALQGTEDLWWGDVHLVQCFRISAVPLGADTSKRSTRSDNYELDVDLPLTAGRPF